MAQHAKLSPSSSAKWSLCAAAPSREEPFPNTSNEFADWGTIAHDISEKCLNTTDFQPLTLRLGCLAKVVDGDVIYGAKTSPMFQDTPGIEVDDEMGECVRTYVNFVRNLAKGGELFVEEKLSLEHITGEEDATGTSDTVILFPDEICIVDLKGGMNKVFASEEVPETTDVDGVVTRQHVKPNTQLLMYADAAVEKFSLFQEFKRVRIIIVQPRLRHVHEHVMTIEEHREWVNWIRERAEATRQPNPAATPGAKQCHYCRASGNCPEQAAAVLQEVFGDFDSLEDADIRNVETVELPLVYAKLDMIEGFVQAIRERVFDELNAGRPVGTYKLVEGKMGNRKWVSEDKALEMLKALRLKKDEMYNSKIISPTDAEKLLKKAPDKWKQLAGIIVRPPGSPTVVPGTDPRPAIVTQHTDDFEDESFTPAASDDMADLFN